MARFAEQLVDRGGVQLLMTLPHSPHTRGFVSMALFCLASIPQALERMVNTASAPLAAKCIQLSTADQLHCRPALQNACCHGITLQIACQSSYTRLTA